MTESQMVIEITGDEELGQFLDKTLCSFLNTRNPEWEKIIIAKSPIIGPYLVNGLREKLSVDTNSVKLSIPKPGIPGPNHSRSTVELRCPWSVILEGISVPIAVACAAGAAKAFIDLLKLWVEERKGRRVKIKRGDLEVEIQGGVSTKDIEMATKIFEDHFGKSRILKS